MNEIKQNRQSNKENRYNIYKSSTQKSKSLNQIYSLLKKEAYESRQKQNHKKDIDSDLFYEDRQFDFDKQQQIQFELSLKNNKPRFSSTIQMLKKQAKLLQQEDRLGTIQQISQLNTIVSHPSNIPLQNVDMNQQTMGGKLSNATIEEDCLNKKLNKSKHFRKVARGRPELYNWVRKYKQQQTEKQGLIHFKGQYQTQLLKKQKQGGQLGLPYDTKYNEKQLCKNSAINLFHKPNKILTNEKKDLPKKRKVGKRGATFIQRLKTLQQNKEDRNRLLNGYACAEAYTQKNSSKAKMTRNNFYRLNSQCAEKLEQQHLKLKIKTEFE